MSFMTEQTALSPEDTNLGRDQYTQAIQRRPAPPRAHKLHEKSSPVNENGSFEHDRVIKSGSVLKRTRRTKSWRNIYMFLRPQSLSIYRDSEGTELRHCVALAEVTAVARQKDPKGRVSHVFAVFTPSRNYTLAAHSEQEAHAWVDVIGREARIDQDEYDMGIAGPSASRRPSQPDVDGQGADMTAIYSSSDADENRAQQPWTRRHTPGRLSTVKRRSSRRASHGRSDASGNEALSYSDNSDTVGVVAGVSTLSLALPTSEAPEEPNAVYGTPPQASNTRSNTDLMLNSHTKAIELERVACHGWVKYLKGSLHLRQWKDVWMVLRPKSLALYKSGDEYAAIHVIPFASIVDALDIDPISHTKRCCMQIITEDRDYKFCVEDEDDLARWIGSFKSLLVKRRESLKSKTSTTTT